VDSSTLRRLARSLSADEQARAGRFRFPEDGARFTAARGILRDILARYSGEEPGRLAFGYGAGGKPFLISQGSALSLEFNVSHSRRIALYAVAHGRAVGVDVEVIRPEMDCERIAERFFTPREAAALRAMPPPVRVAAFFRCWTRKEAYLKATGEGLRIGLKSCEVSLEAGDGDALRQVSGDPSAAARWLVADVAVGVDCAAALAAGRKTIGRRFLDWAGPLG
jgi:4'-phosphopantetheinyl transferase